MVATFWSETVRHWPPSRRDAWLRSQEAIAGLGARRCNELRKDLSALRDRTAAAVPSSAWLDAVMDHNAIFPPPVETSDPRFGRGMVLSAQSIRLGDGKASRRWTSPLAADLEDRLDKMDYAQAMMHEFPPSCSAVAIWKISQRGGHEVGNRNKDR